MFDVIEADPQNPAPAGFAPAHLLAEAAGDQPAAPGAAPAAAAAPAAPAGDPAREAAELIEFARSLLLPMYPQLATVYTPEVCKRLGEAGAPVLAKYGLTLGGLFDRWAPEIGFAIVALPLVRPTIDAMRADNGKAAEPAAAAVPAPVEVKPAADASPIDRFPGLNAGS